MSVLNLLRLVYVSPWKCSMCTWKMCIVGLGMFCVYVMSIWFDVSFASKVSVSSLACCLMLCHWWKRVWKSPTSIAAAASLRTSHTSSWRPLLYCVRQFLSFRSVNIALYILASLSLVHISKCCPFIGVSPVSLCNVHFFYLITFLWLEI